MATMDFDLAAIPREFPQFGKSVWNLGRTREEVFGGKGSKCGTAGAGSGKCAVAGCSCSGCGCEGGSCGCSSGGGCGSTGGRHAQDAEGDPFGLGDPQVPVDPVYAARRDWGPRTRGGLIRRTEGGEDPCPRECLDLASRIARCCDRARLEQDYAAAERYRVAKCAPMIDGYSDCLMQWECPMWRCPTDRLIPDCCAPRCQSWCDQVGKEALQDPVDWDRLRQAMNAVSTCYGSGRSPLNCSRSLCEAECARVGKKCRAAVLASCALSALGYLKCVGVGFLACEIIEVACWLDCQRCRNP
jgi:hypothetical protein